VETAEAEAADRSTAPKTNGTEASGAVGWLVMARVRPDVWLAWPRFYLCASFCLYETRPSPRYKQPVSAGCYRASRVQARFVEDGRFSFCTNCRRPESSKTALSILRLLSCAIFSPRSHHRLLLLLQHQHSPKQTATEPHLTGNQGGNQNL
jgi:hypothetical protein